jgi:2,4-dienoyl-CoA reductase-like NADH-dependent reductase (Old Yellow Enzyme family)
MRAPAGLIGETPVGPSDDEDTGARALTHDEVRGLVDDFVAAALRAERAGFDGVEIHGAHGYVISQFLSPGINRRRDEYGGTPENRARLLFQIVDGVRTACRPDFVLGVRLSPERFGLRLAEIVEVARRLLADGNIDLLDLSLWDVDKEPEEADFKGRSLLSCFTALDRGEVRLGAAGKIMSGADVRRVLEAGADFAIVGRAAILHHDFPRCVAADPQFHPASLPVTADYLHGQGLGSAFVRYLGNWKGFVATPQG